MFTLLLPVGLLFNDAPTPAALVGADNVEMDLYLFKVEFLRLVGQLADQHITPEPLRPGGHCVHR